MISTPFKPVNTDFSADLNAAQQQAIAHDNGPALILAGAGTGKTKVLTHRLARLLATGLARPHEIVAVTFTNKAAREMRDRVAELLRLPDLGRMLLGTFHAIGARIVRQHAELTGLSDRFTIIDPDDQNRLIKKIMIELNCDSKLYPPRAILNRIEDWKTRLIKPEALGNNQYASEERQLAARIYLEYQRRIVQLDCADFNDLLILPIQLLQQQTAVRDYWQNRVKFLLVDEYQDTNHAQETLLRLLASPQNNIFCVGDEDQSIYSWRGADIRNILEFQQHYPDAQVIKLEQNYRSTGNILKAASSLIANNNKRLDKEIFQVGNSGPPLRILEAFDSEDEASRIIHEVANIQAQGRKLNEIAILVRVAAQTRILEEKCLAMELPYVIYGGFRFYEREEIRDCIAYLRIIQQPRDDLALERIINKPPRGIGDKTKGLIAKLARSRNITQLEAMQILVRSDELKPAARQALDRFLANYYRWRKLADEVEHTELLERVLDESGYSRLLNKNDNLQAAAKLDNIKELLAAMQELPDLEAFLEHIALVLDRQANDGSDRLAIMTIHSAKGLEFDHVYLPGWEEGIIPHERSLQNLRIDEVEEERRLGYVAITRARHQLTISYARRRQLRGVFCTSSPSRFLAELPAEQFIQVAPSLPGAFAGSRNHHRSQSVNHGNLPRGAPGRTKTLTIGSRCLHQQFGQGRIIGFEDVDLAVIDFVKFGRKLVITDNLYEIN